MEQTKALNALEPFLALTKSATSPRAAADLITRATSAPNTFIFSELLAAPQVQALALSAEFAPYLRVLEIFSHGTYGAYTSAATALPALSAAQQLKLRQLSLLTLAADSSKTDYASLMASVHLASARELEELVISAIYAGLVDAQLDPQHALVQINSVAALRDVSPSDVAAIPGLLSSLQSWAGRCEATLHSLEAQMSQLRADADRRAAEAASWTGRMEKLVDDEKKGGAASSSSHATDLGAGHKSSMLTVGGSGSIFSGLAGGGGGAGAGAGAGTGGAAGPASAAARRASYAQRFNKRGSGHMEASGGGDAEDEAMDVDDEDEDDKKRASRRKLLD
ncbi:PCI domain-containing protein [Podospora appendiculata]|uniref:PCI domain-containing protein n=1 Tax=Podospora appendiculata TaxID=314037 RepID=A0AAE0XHJ2_9PEZI|nr:PCI domain-containing protein [Podospora appendiculata]